MEWIHYPVLVVVVSFVVLFAVRWFPWFSRGKGYHKWFYADEYQDENNETKIAINNMAGTTMIKPIVVHRKDSLIFVNRASQDVKINFASEGIFGAANRTFTIAKEKRKIRKVIGGNGDYTFTVEYGGSGVIPPKVVVGEDP